MRFQNYLRPALLPVFTLIAGLLGLVLQLTLYLTGFDEKGLLVTGHPAGVFLYILTALVLLALLLMVRSLNDIRKYSRLFPASLLSAIGCFAAAAGIVLTAVTEILKQHSFFTILSTVVALAAAAGLVLVGLCRRKGLCPDFGPHALLTVYFMIHLIAQFRVWSAEPQVLLCFFPLLSSIFLMLTAYHATCLDAQRGHRRWYAFCNQAALFFCCVSLVSSNWLFYLSMALWVGTNLCSMGISKPRPQENMEA